jgi:hypothetical protein
MLHHRSHLQTCTHTHLSLTHPYLTTPPPSLLLLKSNQYLYYHSSLTLALPHAEITFYLGYEATRHLKTIPHPVETPMGVRHEGVDLAHGGQCIIPILRAGLAMGDGMMELLPDAGK